MPSLWEAFKNKLDERLNWDTFKKEISQGFETMPIAGNIPIPTSKIPAIIKATNLADVAIEDLAPVIAESTSLRTPIYRKAFFDADTARIYALNKETTTLHHPDIAEMLGFKRGKEWVDFSSEALRNNLIRYYNRAGEINLEAVANKKTVGMLKKLVEEKLPLSDNYNIDLHLPSRVESLLPGSASSVQGVSYDKVVKYLRELLSKL